MFRLIARLLPLLLLFCFHLHNVKAQQAGHPPSLALGDAVVTGFSGTIAPDATKPRPPNRSAIDLTFINPDGPSARIIGLGQPGFVWDGRVFAASKPFDVLAKDVGQVFGAALDDSAAPNIYLAATSAFGLQLVSPGADGQPQRRKVGGPAAGWMKGQFGLDRQGDPGSIYKVDGSTGVVTLFAKVMLNGVPNPGAGLGNLAYDAAHKQLFVSDLYTGMIHRFAIADGSEDGPPYDHGVTGRGAAHLSPVPFDPGNRPNIASSKFDSGNPDTWGFAKPERRVWAVMVHDGRLFYSVRNGAATQGPQIWSVGIQQDGSLAADARQEVEVPAQPGPYPVSDIAFAQDGAMILAQRAPIAASYDYSAFTKSGQPRVLRYSPASPNDPNAPNGWVAVPGEYAVGFPDAYRKSNGGVDLGYGYDHDGHIDAKSCDSAIWITGENLRNDPALRDRLLPGGPLVVHGVQGSDSHAVRDANAPPWASYFVAYDDKFDDPNFHGHLGVVRINRVACGGAPVVVSGGSAGPSAGAGGGGGGGGANGGGGGGGGQGPACYAPAGLSLPACTYPGQTVSLDLSTATSGVDSNWTVTSSVTLNNLGNANPPVGPHPYSTSFGPWTALAGHWVQPFQSSTVYNEAGPGTYTYTRSFYLPCQPKNYRSITLSGNMAADNGVTIALNGHTLPPGCYPNAPYPYCFNTPATGTPFSATGPAFFVPGLNSLTATVTNKPNNNPNWTGLSVIATLNATCGPECVCSPCPPPMVQGAAPGVCVCPSGTVQQGNQCVAQTCPPPKVVNPATGECVCPPGTVPEGNECVAQTSPGGSLIVQKTITSPTDYVPPAGSITVQVTATCSPPPNYGPFPVVNGGSYTINNIPLGTTCTVAENTSSPPSLPPNACPAGETATWATPTYTPPSVVIGQTPATITVNNKWTCGPAASCPPPMVQGAAPGVCVCPEGTVQHGKECVPRGRPIECRRPLIPNAAGTACVCPDDMVRKGRACVHPAVKCPRGMVNVDGRCVRKPPEREQPGRNPNRPTGFPGRGGGESGGGGGGGGGRR